MPSTLFFAVKAGAKKLKCQTPKVDINRTTSSYKNGDCPPPSHRPLPLRLPPRHATDLPPRRGPRPNLHAHSVAVPQPGPLVPARVRALRRPAAQQAPLRDDDNDGTSRAADHGHVDRRAHRDPEGAAFLRGRGDEVRVWARGSHDDGPGTDANHPRLRRFLC